MTTVAALPLFLHQEVVTLVTLASFPLRVFARTLKVMDSG